jgi:ADP-heptose:LPS heptosyltransferase
VLFNIVMEKFHVLIIRFSSIGDIILATAMVAALRFKFGDKIYITFVVFEEFKSLLEGHKEIDTIVGVPRVKGINGIKSVIEPLKSFHLNNNFDLIMDLHSTIRSFFISAYFWKIPKIKISKHRIKRWLLVKLKLNFYKKFNVEKLHIKRSLKSFNMYFNFYKNQEYKTEIIKKISNSINLKGELEQLTSISIFNNKPLEEKTFESLNLKILNQVNIKNKEFIVFMPSAAHETKRWSTYKYKSLILSLLENKSYDSYSFIILAGPKDTFCDVFNNLGKRVINLQGKTSLNESSLVLKYAKSFVSNDTGMAHIAESLGVPGVMIFGPTVEEFGFGPHLSNSRMVSKRIWCRPCSIHGSKKCFRSKQYCLEDISTEEVAENLKGVMFR